MATAIEPANIREYVPAARLLEATARHGAIEIVDIDRGYLSSPAIEALHAAGTTIYAKPWNASNRGLFRKSDFHIDLRRGRVRCPAGQIAKILPCNTALFAATTCGQCELKQLCTRGPAGRSITVHPAEALFIALRKNAKTRKGREELRERAAVEHRLARVTQIQGVRARYYGARKNELDLNRTAAVANLLEVARLRAA